MSKNSMVFCPFPHYVEIIQNEDNGLLTVKTNVALVKNVRVEDLQTVAYMYAGLKGVQVELVSKDEGLRLKFLSCLEHAMRLHPFFDDQHPVLENAYHNWAHAYSNQDKFTSASALKDVAKNKPILFIAGGPSVNKNIEKLKELVKSGRFISVAAGSGIRHCSNAGIFPDLALAFDPTIHEKHVLFDHISPEFFENVPFIVNQGLHKDCFKMLKNALLIGSSSLPDLCQYVDKTIPLLQEGTIGVATMMPFLCQYMGASEVYMAGVDLHLTDDGRRYADEVISHHDTEQEIVYKGIRTRVAWLKEAEDINASLKAVGLKSYNINKQSVLCKMGSKSININKLFKLPVLAGRVVYTPIPLGKTEDQMIQVLEEIQSDLKTMLEYESPEDFPDKILATGAFIGAIGTFDLLQTTTSIRTGFYNKAFVRLVIRKNLELVTEALSLITSRGNTPCQKSDKIIPIAR